MSAGESARENTHWLHRDEHSTSVFTASTAKDSLVLNHPRSAEWEPPGNQVAIKSSACSERSENTVCLNACLNQGQKTCLLVLEQTTDLMTPPTEKSQHRERHFGTTSVPRAGNRAGWRRGGLLAASACSQNSKVLISGADSELGVEGQECTECPRRWAGRDTAMGAMEIKSHCNEVNNFH